MAKKTAQSLTSIAVRNLKADPSKRREVPDAEVPGLHLVIQPTGKKSWAFRYRYAGKPQKLTLGPLLVLEPGQNDDQVSVIGSALTLKGARELARAESNKVSRGTNPAAEKRETRRSGKAPADKDLFKTVLETFIKKHSSKLRSAGEIERMLNRDVLPAWRDKAIQSITKRDVFDLIEAIRERGADVMANRVFAAIRKLFNWACARDIIKASPCDGIELTPETTRDRTLNDDEVRCFWQACGKINYPFGPLFKMLLLTGQRLSEVADMTRSEVKVADKIWTIPRERAKNNEVHDVPLSDAALQILEGLPEIERKKTLYFTTTGETSVSGFSRAKSILDNEMLKIAEGQPKIWGGKPEISPWRIHDLRRTAASNMARIGISLPVIEKVLNHRSGSFSGIVGVYQRHSFADEKRKALDEWAALVQRLVEPKGNNVIELRRG